MPTDADVSAELNLGWLAGRTFLLRGASGAVGQAVCRRLCAAGANVAAATHKPRAIAALEASLEGCHHLVGHVPTGDGEAAAGFVKGVLDSLGPIDAFVSTAGRFATAPIHTTRTGDDLALLQANFTTVHDLVRAVVGPMMRRKTGSFVFTGARVVGRGVRGLALYTAAKAALHAYAACLRTEVAAAGLGVTVIAPGVLDTGANRSAMPDADRSDWIPVERVVDALLTASRRGADDDELVREP